MGLVQSILASLFFFRTQQQSSPLPTVIPLKPGPPQTPRRQPPHEYCSLGPSQLGSWRAQKEQFMRNPSLTASPKQRTRPQNITVTPPVFRLPSLTPVNDWNARVDGGGTYQLSTFHPRQPLPAVIITPCTPEKKPAFTASLFSSATTVPKGPEDDNEDIALKRVMEDLESALVQREREDVNPFDLSPSSPSTDSNSNSSSKDPDPPFFNISHSLQLSLSTSKQSQEGSTCSSSPPSDASWDVPWESSSPGKAIKYMTSTPPLSWSLGSVNTEIQQEQDDLFVNSEKSRRTSAPPYTDLFDLDMYLESGASLANIDLGVCSLESENPFEDMFAVEPEPVVVVTESPENAAVAVMNRSLDRERERDVYRPRGYTRSPRFMFSVDENGSPVPLTQRRRMTVVDNVRKELGLFLDDDESASGDEEEGGDADGDTSEISVPTLKARLREACRKTDPDLDVKGHGLFCVDADSFGATGHGNLATASQRKSVPSASMVTGSPRPGLGAPTRAFSLAASSGNHSNLAAPPPASLHAASLASSQHAASLAPSQDAASQSALRPSSRLLRNITNTMTTSTSSSSTSTLASIQVPHGSRPTVHNPILTQKNPIESETLNPIIALKNPTSTQKLKTQKPNTKTRNPVVRFGRDIANIVVDDSTNSFSLGGGNVSAGGGVENMTMGSVYSGENTMGSVYSGENTTGSVYAQNRLTYVYEHNNTTYSDEAIALALKARVRQACDNFSKSVWVEECDAVPSWEPVPF